MMGTWRMGGLGMCLLSVACQDDYSLSQAEGEMEVSPALLDLGSVALGSDLAFDFQADHLGGSEVAIRNVVVTNIQGEQFHYDGLDEVLGIEGGGSLDIPFVYRASVVGYHRAKVSFTHTGKDSPAEVEVRAYTGEAEVLVFPMALDFGPVAPGDEAFQTVVLDNLGVLTLLVTEAQLSNDTFDVGGKFPFTLQPGAQHTLDVRFAPDTEEAQTGVMTVMLGDVALSEVILVGNDCEGGVAAIYDQDEDGRTSCAGDCDDTDDTVRGGFPEVADRVDQDCDGLVDEGTAWADDDGDGYCEGPEECSDKAIPGDCHDGNALVNPGQSEDVNNGIDDDCDGVVDMGTTDLDGDGFAPDRDAGGDCDDEDASIFPGAPELPDGRDQDCDELIDEGTIYADDDGDGYCEGPICSDGSDPQDCDDSTTDMDGDAVFDGADTYPSAPELADWRDNNCDGIVDENTEHSDDDGDGFTELGGDCDDTDPTVSPAFGDC
jgi:hypothetical protein